MATVKMLLMPEESSFPTATFPELVKVNGTSFSYFVLRFDAATKETCFFKFKASSYGSGNLTLVVRWHAVSATSGDVIWGCQLAAITPDTDTQDVETKALATAQTVTDTHLGTTAHRVHTCSITISNLDSLTADDECYLSFYRDAAAGGDTMTGDGVLLEMELQWSDT